MELTTKARYATRIMVSLALHGEGALVRKQSIAETEAISEDYAEQLLTRLRAAGLVTSRRGKKGGFSLARDPAAITATEVIESVEGKVVLAPCVPDQCSREAFCATKELWQRATEALKKVLSGTTIADLAARSRELSTAGCQSFHI